MTSIVEVAAIIIVVAAVIYVVSMIAGVIAVMRFKSRRNEPA